ncbi:Chitin synthase, class 3 [Sorochytrium milnesiophthora]
MSAHPQLDPAEFDGEGPAGLLPRHLEEAMRQIDSSPPQTPTSLPQKDKKLRKKKRAADRERRPKSAMTTLSMQSDGNASAPYPYSDYQLDAPLSAATSNSFASSSHLGLDHYTGGGAHTHDDIHNNNDDDDVPLARRPQSRAPYLQPNVSAGTLDAAARGIHQSQRYNNNNGGSSSTSNSHLNLIDPLQVDEDDLVPLARSSFFSSSPTPMPLQQSQLHHRHRAQVHEASEEEDVPLAMAWRQSANPTADATFAVSPSTTSLSLSGAGVVGRFEPVEDEHSRLDMLRHIRSPNSSLPRNNPYLSDPESQQQKVGRKKSLTKPERRRDPHAFRALSEKSPLSTNVYSADAPGSSGKLGGSGAGGARQPTSAGVPPPPVISRKPGVGVMLKNDYARPTTLCRRVWVAVSHCLTFYALPMFLNCCGLRTPEVQQAWREKMALCTLIFLLMGVIGFLTFGLQLTLCSTVERRDAFNLDNGNILINGFALSVYDYPHNFEKEGHLPLEQVYSQRPSWAKRDLSFMFQNTFANLPGCKTMFGDNYIGDDDMLYYCTMGGQNPQSAQTLGRYPAEYCHRNAAALKADIDVMIKTGRRIDAYVTWDTVHNPKNTLFVYNGMVIDYSKLSLLKKPIANMRNVNGVNLQDVFAKYRNTDASYFFNGNATMSDIATCLSRIALVGSIDSDPIGCIASRVIEYLSLGVIGILILVRFFMALLFSWCLSRRLGARLSPAEKRHYIEQSQRLHQIRSVEPGANPKRSGTYNNDSPVTYARPLSAIGSIGRASFTSDRARMSVIGGGNGAQRALDLSQLTLDNGSDKRASMLSERFADDSDLIDAAVPAGPLDITKHEVMHTICLVTCYSEDEAGIKATLDSLAATTYLDSHKILFVVADGLIKGSGNDKTTPEIIVSLMELDPSFPAIPKPYSYVAIAEGARRHNMAQVYAGYYNYDDRRVPMIVVVKCGTPAEQLTPKPGNRGKRDSQIVLMSFLQKVMFDERMTPMEYDLFQKIQKVARVNPDRYEVVMMVDADTIVFKDALERMVACFVRDHNVMGLCGETTISNKFGSFTTAIQVFEYYISHHLAKSFEAVFGGVTCLPGCFCAYRIKAPKGNSGFWVPIIANPDIVEDYSENVIDTLHKKNLYLLGEDRYLTTLMLRSFPKRKMTFVPQAKCSTLVPDTFSVLLSQRRRWINSTIHNLMELVLVKDLCGTFCISMQFVIFMELLGTLVLPAAISFTIFLIVYAVMNPVLALVPLILLAAVLGLPAVLIVMTARDITMVFWMVVYLCSLVIWNAVLPLYAFWHFDDFSWGATRQVEGLKKDTHGADDGEFDSSKIVMKRYAEWEQIKRKAIAQAMSSSTTTAPAGAAAGRPMSSASAQLLSAAGAVVAAAGAAGPSRSYFGVPNTILRGGVMAEYDGQVAENSAATLSPMTVHDEGLP